MKRFVILIIGLVAMCFSAEAQLTDQQQIQKLNLVYQQIRNNYVDDVPLEPLVEEAIIATIKELDPHSSYLTKEEMSALRTRLSGEFAGVGIRYLMHNDTLVVRTTLANSPAERAKILPNDRIVSIDNHSIIAIPTDSVATLLRGNPHTDVRLGIIRRGEDKPLNITLQRDNIESSAISAAFRIGDIGYISVSTFSKPVASEFYSAYRALGDIEHLIVDLRDNAGGAITSAIDLTGLFLRKGDVVVSTEGRNNNIVYDAKRDGLLRDIPITVIINENSASASEIFAGAIQDHDRGTIIGRTSYGKGLVQRVVDLKDGSGICLTVARYKTPSGRVIQRPYAMGDAESYASDTLRYMHPDSIPHDHELLYHTLKLGRKVYGGGGITPDLYISSDTLRLSPSVAQSVAEAAFEHTAVEFYDKVAVEDIIAAYPTIDDFIANYDITTIALALYREQAPYVTLDTTPLDDAYIRTMLMAVIAEVVYGVNARHYVYATLLDPMVGEAVRLIESNQHRSPYYFD